jgi:hypothetical protein
VRHERHYTVEEARTQLAWVGGQLEAMRDARERLTNAEARAAISEATATNGGGTPGRQVGEAFRDLRSGLAALAEREIVLRDLDRGLVDFPAIRAEVEVYLCWVQGEEDIGYWHELDAGYAGRQEL